MKTTDMTPTWSAILPVLLTAIETRLAAGNDTDAVKKELARMAAAADAWNVIVKCIKKADEEATSDEEWAQIVRRTANE